MKGWEDDMPTIPCPIKVNCPGVDLPFRNFSSEAPDIPSEPIPFGGIYTPYVPPLLSPESGGGSAAPTCPEGYTYDSDSGLCVSNSGTNPPVPPIPPAPPAPPFTCPDGQYFNGDPDIESCVPIEITGYSPAPICLHNPPLTSFYGVGFSGIPGYPGGLSIEFGDGHFYSADFGFVSPTEIQLSAFAMQSIVNILGGTGNFSVKLTTGLGVQSTLPDGITIVDCDCPDGYYFEASVNACVPIADPCDTGNGYTRFFGDIDINRLSSVGYLITLTPSTNPNDSPNVVQVTYTSQYEMCVRDLSAYGSAPVYLWYNDTWPAPDSYIGRYN